MSDDTCLLGGNRVHRLGFGAMQLPGHGAFGPPRSRQDALDVLRYAVRAGVSHIDTAQFYGPDVANDLICEAQQSIESLSSNSHAEGLFALGNAIREMLEQLRV